LKFVPEYRFRLSVEAEGYYEFGDGGFDVEYVFGVYCEICL